MKNTITIIIFLLVSFYSFAQTYSGRAVKVADGDTFTLLLPNNTTIRVRLFGIDCPEKGQDFSSVAKDFTKTYLQNKTVTVQQKDIDRYGRVVAITFAGLEKQSLNEALLRNGLAWHYTHYDKNPNWSALEHEAKMQRKGIWKLPGAIAPWQFRAEKRVAQP